MTPRTEDVNTGWISKAASKDKIFSRDFEIWILILFKIYITQKNKMAEFKMVEFKMADIIGKK